MPHRLAMLSHAFATAVQAVGSVALALVAFVVAEVPNVVAEHPTPVLVSVAVGVASVLAPGLWEYMRRRQERRAVVEDRDLQGQLDKLKADADAAHAKADTLRAEVDAEKVRAAAEITRIRADAADAIEKEHRKADEAQAVASSALVRLRNVEMQVESNTAGVGAAKGTAEAAIDAIRSGDGIPALPAGAPVPGTDWPLVLLAEDDAGSTAALTRLLKLNGYRVAHAASLTEALLLLPENPSVIVADLNLVGGNGETVIRKAREAGSRARAIVYSGWYDPDTEARLRAMGVEAVILKAAGGAESVLAAIRGAK
jgi:CheY-like chemotaxis protein